MTTYRNDEKIVRRIEFAVAAGSDIGTVNKVSAIAWADYCTRTGTKTNAVPDDWCTVNVTDDEIVFAFTVEHTPDAATRALDRARAEAINLVERAGFGRGTGPGGRLEPIDFTDLMSAFGGAGVG